MDQTIEDLKKERAKHKPKSKEYVKISNKIAALNRKLGLKKEKKSEARKQEPIQKIDTAQRHAINYIFDRAKTLYLEGFKKHAMILLETLK